jgi:TRAP-type C4-dicarboxylate transport system permease small subunit
MLLGQKEAGWLHKLAHTLNGIGVVLIFLLMFLTVADVVLRKILNQGILGTLEVSEFMMVAIVYFSLAAGELKERNVNVDLLINRLSLKSQAIIDAVVKTFGFILYCLIAYAVFGYAALMKSSGEVSLDLLLPKYPLIYIVALALIPFSLVLLFRMFVAWQNLRRLWIR